LIVGSRVKKEEEEEEEEPEIEVVDGSSRLARRDFESVPCQLPLPSMKQRCQMTSLGDETLTLHHRVSNY
jgi:hypothetical protein